MLSMACAPHRLAPREKHYFINSNFDKLPVSPGIGGSASITLDMHANPADFRDAVLRLEMQDTAWGMCFDVTLNGTPLTPSPYVGELFAPFTRESLPPACNVENYRLAPNLLRVGGNTITITRNSDSAIARSLVCRRLELALYPYPLPACMTGGKED
jgi:hypothetical protein